MNVRRSLHSDVLVRRAFLKIIAESVSDMAGIQFMNIKCEHVGNVLYCQLHVFLMKCILFESLKKVNIVIFS